MRRIATNSYCKSYLLRLRFFDLPYVRRRILDEKNTRKTIENIFNRCSHFVRLIEWSPRHEFLLRACIVAYHIGVE